MQILNRSGECLIYNIYAHSFTSYPRTALESSTLNYLLAHFHDGVGSVFSVAENKFFIQIVANKYNPANYW